MRHQSNTSAVDPGAGMMSPAGCGSLRSVGCACFLGELSFSPRAIAPSCICASCSFQSSLCVSLATPSLFPSPIWLIIPFMEVGLFHITCAFFVLNGPRGIGLQKEWASLPGSTAFSSCTYALAALGKLPHQRHRAKHLPSGLFCGWPR